MTSRLSPLLSLLVLPAFALAEDKPAAGDPAESHEGGLIERLEQFSTIASGKESKWEAKFKENNAAGFKKWDTDGDGKISVDEAKAAVAKIGAMLKEKNPELFKSIDSDGDGAISADEAKAAREKWAKEHKPEKKADAPAK